MSDYEEKHALYKKYLDELDSFRSRPLHISDRECREICDDYIMSEKSSWHNITDPESGAIVGFVIFGKEYPEKHPDSLRSIAQAYVLPEYRRRGLMSAVVSDYMTRKRGVFSLLVVNGNEYAAGFWKRFFEKNGYTAAQLSPVKHEDDDVTMYAYKPC